MNIKVNFDYFVKTLKVIEKLEDVESEIKEGATEEEITEYEQKIGYTLPEDFKDWLRLTKGLSASVGITCINIYMPKKAQKHVDGFMALFFGDDCGFRSYYINLENGKGYIYDDDVARYACLLSMHLYINILLDLEKNKPNVYFNWMLNRIINATEGELKKNPVFIGFEWDMS